MDDNYKARIEKSVLKFCSKNDPARPKRKNQKPEKEFVEKPCLQWMTGHGWSVSIFEAKATYSEARGGYYSQSMKAGIVDCIGNDQNGHAVYVEFKAPGKRSNLKENQRQFLTEKIESNAFAVVVDSVESLKRFYDAFSLLKTREKDYKGFLKKMLPAVKKKKPNKTDDLPW